MLITRCDGAFTKIILNFNNILPLSYLSFTYLLMILIYCMLIRIFKKTLISTVNSQLLLLQEWLATNKLTLNFKKSNFVIFHHYRKTLPRDINIKMFDNTSNKFVSLGSKKTVKYLGLLIYKDLTWNLISIILAIKLVKR